MKSLAVLSIVGLCCCSFLLFATCDIRGSTKLRAETAAKEIRQIRGNEESTIPRGVANDHGGPIILPRLNRLRRAPRLKSPSRKGTALAQRPKSSTTTSTTTTEAATTEPARVIEEKISSADEEKPTNKGDVSSATGDDENAGDDYEDIGSSAGRETTKKLKSSPTTAKPSKQPEKEEPEEEAEIEEEKDVRENEAESSDEATKATTTNGKSKSSEGKKTIKQPGKNKTRLKSTDNDDEDEAETSDDNKGKSVGSGPDTKVPAREHPNAPQEATTASSMATSKDKMAKRKKKKPLVTLPFIKPKNASVCIPEAYLEFPRDLIGDKWRGRGLIVVHVLVVCYMFYSLALVCERYFMPSLEEFSQRLGLSEDVAGATLMSAGSSAPELFTAILGVFVAKGDVGTGAIVGSAVFNILFVIGICAFVSTTTAQLNWWPVLRDSVFYTFTVLVLILFIYDERITAIESSLMIALYGVYILIMVHNEAIKRRVTQTLQSYPLTAKLLRSAVSLDGPDDVFAGGSSSSAKQTYQTTSLVNGRPRMAKQTNVEDDSIYLAALLIIVKHKRLFRPQIRFQSAARYIIVKRQHKLQQQQKSIKCSNEVNYFGPESEPLRPDRMLGGGGGGTTSQSAAAANQRERMEAYARSATASKSKFSIVSKDDYEFWNRPPGEDENYYLWLAKIPVNYVLHYTIPDCSLYPDKYLFTFFISILWTALFSYIMVWMVTLIGYTFGIPDSVMGVTFLAAGTSVPDCYSSVHAARNGMADMAVSNSIGSNVFDILIGLSLPWFIQTAIYPGVVATINSRGVIYSVILLFLSLVVTIYLLNKYEWTLKPRLGLALLIAYGLFIVLTCMLEFNLFGHVNPPPCPVA